MGITCIMKSNKTKKIFRPRIIKSAKKYTYSAGNFTYQVSMPYDSEEIIKTYDIVYKEARVSLLNVEFSSCYSLFLTYKVYANLILLVRRHRQCCTFFSANIV